MNERNANTLVEIVFINGTRLELRVWIDYRSIEPHLGPVFVNEIVRLVAEKLGIPTLPTKNYFVKINGEVVSNGEVVTDHRREQRQDNTISIHSMMLHLNTQGERTRII